MEATLSRKDFERIFADKIQIYKAETAAEKAKRKNAEAEKRKAEAEKQEAEARAKAVDELFVSTMNDAICDALCSGGKVKKVPKDVAVKLKQIDSYSLLRKLLRVATSQQDDYESFLETLDESVKK